MTRMNAPRANVEYRVLVEGRELFATPSYALACRELQELKASGAVHSRIVALYSCKR